MAVAPHHHERAQLLYATEGLMRVQTDAGVWILPPRRALWIPPGVVHHWTSLSKVTMRTIYVEAEAAKAFGDGCRVIEVSPLLRELILALLAEPIEYPIPGRGEHLAMLILSELAAAETVPIAIPWPRDRRLVAVCSAIMADPGSSRNIEQWADEVGASAHADPPVPQGDRPALPPVGAAGASGRSVRAAGTGPGRGRDRGGAGLRESERVQRHVPPHPRQDAAALPDRVAHAAYAASSVKRNTAPPPR
jgi:hypothetical protein